MSFEKGVVALEEEGPVEHLLGIGGQERVEAHDDGPDAGIVSGEGEASLGEEVPDQKGEGASAFDRPERFFENAPRFALMLGRGPSLPVF